MATQTSNEFAELAERTSGAGSARRGTSRDEFDITAAPRAVIRESARLLTRVLGAEVLGDARANALQAVRADQENARERAEMARVLEAARHSR